MSVLKIVTYPDPVLKKKTSLIEQVDDHIVALAQDMAETMFSAPGVGLAAPQIGRNLKLIVVDFNRTQRDPEKGRPLILLNPEIVESDGEITFEEGCLSVPDFFVEINRANRIHVKAMDLDENPVDLEAEDYLAVVLQHEIDHLNGTLIIDHISPLKRSLYKRKLKKSLQEKQHQAM